jgi:hypothetical protein
VQEVKLFFKPRSFYVQEILKCVFLLGNSIILIYIGIVLLVVMVHSPMGAVLKLRGREEFERALNFAKEKLSL